MKLEKDERIEDLELNNLKIIQNKSLYCFTSDSAILANFVKTKKTDTCLEIGCGSGVISILVNEKCSPKKIYAFEAQKEMFELASKNIKLNKLEDKIELLNEKVQNFDKHFKQGFFDVVFTNPPYLKTTNKKLLNENSVIANCRHDTLLPLNELASTSSKLLKFGGKFFIVYRPDRLSECLCELSKNKLEPKRLFFVCSKENSSPILFLLEAVKGAKPGIKILPTLIANDKDGNYIYTIQKLYREGLWFILFQHQLEI